MSGDDFGFSVAVGNNVVFVGAPDHVVNGVFVSGASYVFVKPAAGWKTATQTAELSVAICNNIIVAGAGGMADVFTEASGGWTNATQNWRLPSPLGPGNYGNCVAIQSLTIVVGFPQQNEPSGNEVFIWGPA